MIRIMLRRVCSGKELGEGGLAREEEGLLMGGGRHCVPGTI